MKLKELSLMLVVTVFIPLIAGCDKEATRPQETSAALPSIQVSVDRVTKRIADNQIQVVGTVEAVNKAEISAKITGNIISLPVDLGSKVSRGDLLIELSAGEISAQLQQAKAQLEQARRNLAREESLLKKNAATLQTVKTLRDDTKIAQAAYQEAFTMLNYTRITAPFSGIVTRKPANIGDLATPGKPLLYLEDESNLRVVTDIPEAMILTIHPADRLQVFIPSALLTTEGVVAEVSPIADSSSRSAPVKLRIATDPRLRSGQFARVALAKENTETLTVPASAVLPFGQMKRVFIAQNSKARLRLVRTGTKVADRIEILSGLSEGETVITDGNHNLQDEQPIIIQ